MKRREFIRLVSAGVAVVALPVSLLAQPRIDPKLIDWVVTGFDCHFKTGVAIQYDYKGPQWCRHAIICDTPLKDIKPQEVTEIKSILLDWLTERLA